MVSFEFDKILDYIQFECTFYKTYLILYFRKWNSVAELCGLEQNVILDNLEPIAHRPGRKHYCGRLRQEQCTCNCDSENYFDSSVGCLCKNNSVYCIDQHFCVYHSIFLFSVILA